MTAGRRKTGTLLLSLLIAALAGTGLAYGEWAGDLQTDNLTETGTVDMELTSCTCSDPPGTIDMGYDKDAAWCECELMDSDGDGDADVAKVTVHNAYPCYQCLFCVTPTQQRQHPRAPD